MGWHFVRRWSRGRLITVGVALLFLGTGTVVVVALTRSSAVTGCVGAAAPPATSVVLARTPPAAGTARFPVAVSKERRFLVDQDGHPYLIVGDSPWSLSANLSTSDMDLYFSDREANGFNTALVGVLVSSYIGGRDDLSTFDGLVPFTVGTGTSSDLSTPNPAYWSRIDTMVNLARAHGITLMLVPVETGGLLPLLRNNGVAKDFDFGAFLGSRYRSTPNIIWISGNDYWAQHWSDDPYVTAVARGIRSTDPHHLQTAELDVEGSSFGNPNWPPLIDINAVYTYRPTYSQMLRAYNEDGAKPAFMVEANYEYENLTGGPATTDETLRRQEYWTMTSGGTGQLYGNCFIWRMFSDWKSHLDTTAVQQLGLMRRLFAAVAWYDLVPDQVHSVLTAGYGSCSATGDVLNSDCATAASTSDGTLAVVYTPRITTLTINLSAFRGPITARWYDPTTGVFSPAAASPLPNSGTQRFTPVGSNGTRSHDWALVLQAR